MDPPGEKGGVDSLGWMKGRGGLKHPPVPRAKENTGLGMNTEVIIY